MEFKYHGRVERENEHGIMEKCIMVGLMPEKLNVILPIPKTHRASFYAGDIVEIKIRRLDSGVKSI